jgi:adenosylcobyric acid synthase
MTGRLLMVQGTASHVGKSILVTALCRIFKQDGYAVAPFKAQNMSLNSFVTPDGGEIGRAQAVQAEAAGVAPSVEMNPILLKPEAHSRSQVVVLGKVRASVAAGEYYKMKAELFSVVTEALEKLRARYDIVVIEGAGGAAEVNFARTEIVNMGFARHFQAPVLLVGDIERGGVFASLLGTLWLLEPEDARLVKALIINKFCGDIKLLEPGVKFLEEKSGIPVAGVIPYFDHIHIAQEDSVALEHSRPRQKGLMDVAVIRVPHISNFDDFDPLAQESDVQVRFVKSVADLRQPDLIILPGSKTTAADLNWLRESRLADRIIELFKQGAFVIGICGGYQMLGEYVDDPEQVESKVKRQRGLGLLPVTTTFLPEKETHQVEGIVITDEGLLSRAGDMRFTGYEIHMGRTELSGGKPAFRISKRSGQPCSGLDGCIEGRVMGTYIHGLFHNRGLRRAILNHIAQGKGFTLSFSDSKDQGGEYDKLAELVRNSLDMSLIRRIAGLSKGE